jgi:hypothetical protein
MLAIQAKFENKFIPSEARRGTLLILAAVMVTIVGGMALSLLLFTMAGVNREEGRDVKLKSQTIAGATQESRNKGDSFPTDEEFKTLAGMGNEYGSGTGP